jgi:hypothetical protein
MSFIAFRIGVCQRANDNRHGPWIPFGWWGQAMWVSDRDLCRAFELAVEAPETMRFEIFNVVSDNEGMRWDMGKAERLLGFRPEDSSVPVAPRLGRRVVQRLKKMLGLWRQPDTGPPLTG